MHRDLHPHRHRESLHRWLAAERRGREAEAEEILFEVFRALPLTSPAAAFADRVLVGAGVVWSLQARAATAACLLLAGLAAALLVPVAVGALALVPPGDVLAAPFLGLAGAANALDEILSVGRLAARLQEALWLVVTAPPVALTLLAMTALAAFAGHWLAGQLSPYRSLRHVQAL